MRGGLSISSYGSPPVVNFTHQSQLETKLLLRVRFCGVFVVVVAWLCFCVGDMVVFLWCWCGGVLRWCFCGGGVVVFLWWCGGGASFQFHTFFSAPPSVRVSPFDPESKDNLAELALLALSKREVTGSACCCGGGVVVFFCGGVAAFLWWWCFCGVFAVVVWLCLWCGCVFVVAWWYFLWWCDMVVFLWSCGGVFVLVW